MKYQYIRTEYVESKSPLNCKTRILKSNWEELKSISWLTQRVSDLQQSVYWHDITLKCFATWSMNQKDSPFSQPIISILVVVEIFFFATITVLLCRYSTTTPNWLQPVLFFQRTEEWAVLISALPEVILECKRGESSYLLHFKSTSPMN